METRVSKRKLGYIGAFIVMATAILLFTGMRQAEEPQVGRYRMSVVIRSSFTDIFVIDTTTGVVKYVGKDEGKPFAQIRGK
jgi:hypothetical protein